MYAIIAIYKGLYNSAIYFYVNHTQVRIILEEGTSVETIQWAD